MEALYAEAAYCTQGEERARALLESVRFMAATEETNRWLKLAMTLCQQAVFELETRAVEVDALIEAGDTSCRSPYTCSPLATLEALEGQFAVLNSEEEKWPYFRNAVQYGNVEWMDILILAGVDTTAKNNEAIVLASKYGHLSIVDRLLQDPRADPSADGNYAIRSASENGHLPVVDRLLQDARVDPSAEGNQAICAASRNGHLSIVNRLLQDKRVDPSANVNIALQLASSGGHLHVVNRLLQDDRVDPSTHDNSAINSANYHRHFLVVERLLQDERVISTLKDYDLKFLRDNVCSFKQRQIKRGKIIKS